MDSRNVDRFEMCWFYMGIAQIALDPPPSFKRANVEEKNAPNHPGKPLHPLPLRAMSIYGNNTFQKGASLNKVPKHSYERHL